MRRDFSAADWRSGALLSAAVLLPALWYVGADDLSSRLASSPFGPWAYRGVITFAAYLALAALLGHERYYAVAVGEDRMAIPRQLRIALLALAALALLDCAWAGSRHDYASYVRQWQLLLAGGEPWGPHSSNAYGPAYNGFALTFALNLFLPKLAFTAAWVLAAAAVLGRYVQLGASQAAIWAAFAALLLNPLFWVNSVAWGHFDTVVAVACLAAVVLRERRKDMSAAVALALAVLLKYYPALVAPYFCFDGRRINWRFGLTLAFVVVAGLAASWAVWGESTFYPLLFNAERESKNLSIFRYLRGEFSPLRLVSNSPDVDGLSLPALALATAAALLAVWIWRMTIVPAVLVGILTGLTFYKVGHGQFHFVVLLLLVYWLAGVFVDARPAAQRVLRAAMVYIGWIGLVSLLYFVKWLATLPLPRGTLTRWETMSDVVGLPTFLISAWLVIEIVRYERTRPTGRHS